MIYFFVEGFDDNNLVSEIIKGIDNFKIIEYSTEKKEKINSMISTIISRGDKYIFLADLDEKSMENRIIELKKIFKKLDESNIYFAVKEIESWYLAGISDNLLEKYKIKSRLLINTENINKEKFEKLFIKERETILQIKLRLLSEFNIEKAKSRNNSLKLFLEKVSRLFW